MPTRIRANTATPSTQVRMIDIAQQAGVSRSAVSHVLLGTGSGHVRVSEAKATRIREFAKKLNFKPNYAARQLKGKHASAIGMLSSYWRDSLQLRVFSWVQQACAAGGYQVLTTQGGTIDSLNRSVQEFNARGVRGVLCFAYGSDVVDPASQAVLAKMPYVVSLLGQVNIEGAGYVDVDWAAGSKLAVEHLYQKGRRRIALLLEDVDKANNRKRQQGFLRALRSADLVADPRQVVNTQPIIWDIPDHMARVDRILTQLLDELRVDSIIAHDDFTAAFLIQGLTRRGLRVPQDIAIVGHENDLIAPHLNPPLTTIHLPIEQLIVAAVGKLIAVTEGDPGARLPSEIFAPQLIVRSST
jgi:DNA-binding LacI/PurR family transcriptional regulator